MGIAHNQSEFKSRLKPKKRKPTFRSRADKAAMIEVYRAWRDKNITHSWVEPDHAWDLGFRQGVMSALRAVDTGCISPDDAVRWLISAQDELYWPQE